MKVAYLVNQYPKVSHAFIRREILALEQQGVEVVRWSVRPPPEAPVDRVDVDEATKTRVVLDAGWARFLGAVSIALVGRGGRFFRALALAARLAVRSERGLLRHVAYLAEACVLLAWARRSRVEHVHAHFGTNSATVAMLLHALGGPRWSFTVHGPEEFDLAPSLGLREKIARAEFVVAISNFGRSQLFRLTAHAQWSKIKVVRCGVDGEFLAPPPAPLPPTRRLVSIGRLCEQKGQLLLVEALARLRREGLPVEVALVGDGELRSVVAEAIARGQLAEQVRILGWTDGPGIRRALDDSCALVLPSFAEGLPVVIMEALARGRPVLSTFVAGIPELVVPGRNGWLVPAGSVEALAAGLRQVLDTPADALAAMGTRGREDVGRQHDITASARELAALFRAAGASAASGASPSTSN
jgi:colanic acid/amylovoran biosynthesis glycosyltransferase